VSAYLREAVAPEQVVHTFAGVRPLHDDGAAKAAQLTRDYLLVLDAPYREAPLLTIYGGKLTTYRRLAETALAKLARYFTPAPAWTREAPLPGGDFPLAGHDALSARARGLWPFLSESNARRLVAAYGTRLDRVFAGARGIDDVGPHFGPDLTGAEVRYLMREEFAPTADDVLWRRSKLGLRMGPEDVRALERFMMQERMARSS
jgi:glycerol-3-phosphate dehydrogenase